MKKVFELSINGKFTQFLKPSEIKLLKWDKNLTFTLTPVTLNEYEYKKQFNQ